MDIHAVIQSQYHASLEMLAQIVQECPPGLWDREEDHNRFWHLAYHVLFYTHLYLSRTEDDFEPWVKHRPDYNFMGALPWPPYEAPKIEAAYTKTEILDYVEYLRGAIDGLVAAVDLEAESGFSWLPFGKLELQFYNIRHLMQHTGELGERLGHAAQIEVNWIGKWPTGE